MKINSSILQKIPLSSYRGPNSKFFDAENGLRSLQPTLFWQVIFHNKNIFAGTKWDGEIFVSKVTIPTESLQIGSVESGPSVPKAPIVDGKSSPNTFIIGFYVDIYSTLEQSIHKWVKNISRTGVKDNVSNISVYGYQMGGDSGAKLFPDEKGMFPEMDLDPYIQYEFHECFPSNISEYTYDHTNQKWANVRNVTFGYRDYDVYAVGNNLPYKQKVGETNLINEKYSLAEFHKKDRKKTPDSIDLVNFTMSSDDPIESGEPKANGKNWINGSVIGTKKEGYNLEKLIAVKPDDYLEYPPLVRQVQYENGGITIAPEIREPYYRRPDDIKNDTPNQVFHEKNRKLYGFNGVSNDPTDNSDVGPGVYDVSKKAQNREDILFGKILRGNENAPLTDQNDDEPRRTGWYRNVTVPIYLFSPLHSNPMLSEMWKSPSTFKPYGENDTRKEIKYPSIAGATTNDPMLDSIVNSFYRMNYKNRFTGSEFLFLNSGMNGARDDIAEYWDGELVSDPKFSPKIKKVSEYPSGDANPVDKLYKASTPLMNLLKTKVNAWITPDTPNYHGSLRGIAKVIRKVQQWFYAEPKHKTAQKEDVTRIWEGGSAGAFIQGSKVNKDDVTKSTGHGSGIEVGVDKNDHTVSLGHIGASVVDVDPNDFTYKNRHASVDMIPVPKDDTPSGGKFGDTSDVDVGEYDVTTHESHQNVDEKNPDEYDHVVSDDARSISYIYAGDDTVDVDALDRNGVVIREDDIPSGDISVKEIAPLDPDGVSHKEMLFNGNDQVKERYDVGNISNVGSDDLNTRDITIDEKYSDLEDTPKASNISVEERYSDLEDVRDHKSAGKQIKPNDEDVNAGRLDVQMVEPNTMEGVSPGGSAYSGKFEKRVPVSGDDVGHASASRTIHVDRETVNTGSMEVNVVPNRSFAGDVSRTSDKNGKIVPHSDDGAPGHEKPKNIVSVKDEGAASNIDENDIKRIRVNEGDIDTGKLNVSVVNANTEKASGMAVESNEISSSRTSEVLSRGISVKTTTPEMSIMDFARKLANAKLVYPETSGKFDFKVKRIKSDEDNRIFGFDGKTVERKPDVETVPDTGKLTINTIDVSKNNDRIPRKRDLGKQVDVHDFDSAVIGKK